MTADEAKVPTASHYGIFECAMCHGMIPDRELHITLSSGKKICEACIFEALSDKYGREGKE